MTYGNWYQYNRFHIKNTLGGGNADSLDSAIFVSGKALAAGICL